ncbi:hypothetical protein EVAR_75942_1 [Eumeta japonica]|uniref:Uncharacterized protein n=1 Tax=Eumeta variegata TaxID=151549 RepID=A0A4C1UWB0_EUMVA|nr:hypothetical protein EVAR_75942_1 [Eumeta japonica]
MDTSRSPSGAGDSRREITHHKRRRAFTPPPLGATDRRAELPRAAAVPASALRYPGSGAPEACSSIGRMLMASGLHIPYNIHSVIGNGNEPS